MTRRIGVYSGTFDPVHAGHIAFATAAILECRLDEVVFLPEKTPRGKQNVTDISHRVALLETAVEDMPQLRVLQLSSSQFSVQETLPELRAHFGDAQLTLLLGSDVAQSLLGWPDLEILLREISLAIGMRTGDSRKKIEAALRQSSHTLIEADFSDFTSSHVRRGATTHFNLATAEYATKHALYSN